MAGQLQKLKDGGAISGANEAKLTADQRAAIDGLSDSEVDTLITLHKKAAGVASGNADVSGTYPL